MLVAWVIGCGSGSGELRSKPTEPTVDLRAPRGGGAVVWTNLAALFPAEGPGLPAPLASLAPGMGGEEAAAVLEAARAPGVEITREEIGGHVVMHSVLRDWTDVGVSLVLEPGADRLQQVNLTVPADDALVALGDRWGAPEVASGAEGRPVYRWRREGAPWRAELDAVGAERAVLAFERP
jgi:hypothetical protein